MQMAVAAMFECKSVLQRSSWAEDAIYLEVELEPVVDLSDRNKEWSKYTPAGKLQMTITNPDVEGYFVPGKEYKLVISQHQPQKARLSAGEDSAEARTSGEINHE